MHDLGIEFHDIAYLDNEIWYACDNCDSPIKSFSSGGALTFYITDDIVPSAHGLTFEDDEHLWASDIYTDQLYRIDLNPESIGSQRYGDGCSISGPTATPSAPCLHNSR